MAETKATPEDVFRKKLEFLEKEASIASDPERKFAIQSRIRDLHSKVLREKQPDDEGWEGMEVRLSMEAESASRSLARQRSTFVLVTVATGGVTLAASVAGVAAKYVDVEWITRILPEIASGLVSAVIGFYFGRVRAGLRADP